MRSFDQFYALAVARKGTEELDERLATVVSSEELTQIGDDRYLSAMARRVFAAGFVWRVVDAKWPGFEEAFAGFDPVAVAAQGEANPSALLTDTRIIRNGQKIASTYANARFVLEMAAEHGSFGQFIASWSDEQLVDLWTFMKKNGSRLGGDTGPRFLRGMGRDTFILTPDVTKVLTDQGILTGKPTSQKQQRLALEAFLRWKQESGRPMAHISVILACTVDR
ncbi:MAG: 3-methyladenine DNA glycosylase Tag [Myxococcota bacterium]|jgi:3-methyladenine DNA glycosylase Tag